MKIKGVTHVHSLYSDGIASLARIKKEAKKHGINFVLMADHLFRMEDFKRFTKECADLSDDNFLMIPGIEMGSKEGYHFLAYNLSEPPFLADKKVSSQEICEALSGRDSLFVLAHNSLYRRPPVSEILKQLDGIEVWNTKYDTKFAPNVKSLKMTREYNLVPFAAVDAHGRFCLKRLWLELEVERLEKDEITAALKRGDFRVVTRSLSLDLRQKLTSEQEASFRRRNRFYGSVRYPVCAFVRSGISFPKPLVKLYQAMFKWL